MSPLHPATVMVLGEPPLRAVAPKALAPRKVELLRGALRKAEPLLVVPHKVALVKAVPSPPGP
jgi:hypothetical protein